MRNVFNIKNKPNIKRNIKSEIFNEKLLPYILENPCDKSIKLEIDGYMTRKFEKFYGNNKTTIYVENMDCVLVAQDLSRSGKTLLLNMASYKKPGGGVLTGASAQEEEVCRRTNLYSSLKNIEYPLKFRQYIYTPNVSILFDNKYNILSNVSKIDIITIAAINLNTDITEKEYVLGTTDKVYQILLEAKNNNIDNLVLSAFGCGVFGNNPEYVSKIFKKVIDNYFEGCFKNICFAIINDRNSVSNNYEIFNKTFSI